jgi:superfamily II DNA helicase RecQ
MSSVPILCFRGSDFHQDYGRLNMVCALFPNVRLLALTATANKQDQEQIREALGLSNCIEVIVVQTGQIFSMQNISEKGMIMIVLNAYY